MPAPDEPGDEAGDAERRKHPAHAAARADLRGAGLRNGVADRGQRRYPRCSHRREHGGADGDDRPDDHRHDGGASLQNTVPPAGMSMPKPSIICFRPPATTTPATRPMAEAVTPMITASSSWAQSTWRRVAPTDRSRAISRRRWVTMIWNVL